MQSAPSVVYPVGRSAFQAGLLVFLGLAGAVVGVLHMFTSDFSWNFSRNRVAHLVGASGWLCWMAWATVGWLRSPEGSLHWQSVRTHGKTQFGGWSWVDRTGSDPVALSEVKRVLDLQDRVLLCLCLPAAGQRWVWVERSVLPARWGDLRRALISGRS